MPLFDETEDKHTKYSCLVSTNAIWACCAGANLRCLVYAILFASLMQSRSPLKILYTFDKLRWGA